MRTGFFMKIKSESAFRVAVSAIALAVFCGTYLSAAAQNMTSATLSGTVEDANGAYVPGATLTARNIDTNQRRTADSDLQGHFKFPYLPVGNYELTVAQSGFGTLSRNLTLTVGQTLNLVFKLDVNSVS